MINGIHKFMQSIFILETPIEPYKQVSKIDMLTNRYRKVCRLRNLAMEQNNFMKVYQANRLLIIVTKKLNQIHSTFIWN